jgi:excisionase family DNA binding protein
MISKTEKLYSVTEVAKKLGVSRSYILKLIKTGKLRAQKVGATYAIAARDLPGIYRPMNEADKRKVEKAIELVFEDYGEVIKRLGAA